MVPRPSPAPATQLGLAVKTRRGTMSQAAAAVELGLPRTTLATLERGEHSPSPDTARKLATWLGWSLEQVFAAAEQPA